MSRSKLNLHVISSLEVYLFFMQMVFVFLFFSCTTNVESSGYSDKKIVVDPDNLSLLPESAIDTVFYVPLETTDDALIGNHPIIRFGGSEMYVSFFNSTKIVRYDMNGKVQAVIENKGPSNEEYFEIADFFATEKSLFVYDSYLNVLFEYDKNGGFKSRMKLDADVGTSIIPFKDKLLIMRNNPSQSKDALYILDNNGKQQESYLSDKRYNVIRLTANNQLTTMGDTAYIYSLFDPNLYCYDGKKLSVKYSFDFGKRNVPLSFVKDNMNNRSLFEDLCDVDGKIFGLESPAFLDDWIYIGFRQGIFPIKVVINNQTNKMYKLDNDDDTLFRTCSSAWVTYNDFFVTLMRASNVLCMEMYKDKIKTKHNLRLMDVDVDEDSNPVVCFIRFKKDFKE